MYPIGEEFEKDQNVEIDIEATARCYLVIKKKFTSTLN